MKSLASNIKLFEALPLALGSYGLVKAFDTVVTEDANGQEQAFVFTKKSGLNKSDFKKERDWALICCIGGALALSANTAFADRGEFGKDKDSFKWSNASSLYDWLVVAAYAFAAYRFMTKYHATAPAVAVGLAAVLHFVSMTTTKPETTEESGE